MIPASFSSSAASRRWRKALVVIISWLVLATITLTGPANSADAFFDEPEPVPASSIGVRSSDPTRLSRHAVAFTRAADFCPDHWSQELCDAVNGPAAPPEPPTPEPPTPEPTPDPRIAVREAADQAVQFLQNDLIQEAPFELFPGAAAQVVGLRTFLYAGTQPVGHTATQDEFAVTVTAVPIRSLWTFQEAGKGSYGGRSVTVECHGVGQRWTHGARLPACGKDYDHTTDVTGTVKLTVTVEYEFHWEHEHKSGPAHATFAKASTSEADLTVSEVQAWGIQEAGVIGPARRVAPSTHVPKVDCSWQARGVAFVTPFDCGTITQIGDVLLAALGGCFDGIAGRLGDLWETLQAAGSDPVGFVQEKVSGVIDLVELAKNDPEELITQLGYGFLELDAPVDGEPPPDWQSWTPTEWGDWAGGFVCGLAFDYLSGSASQKFMDFLKIKAGRGGDNDGNGNSGDGDGDAGDSDSDADNDGDNDGDGDGDNDGGGNTISPCRSSSFEGDTRVVMGDGSSMRIDEIRPGDRVLSHDFDTGRWEPQLVLDQWSHRDDGPAATITLAGDTITATDDHLFWVQSTQRWTELQHVLPGDELFSPTGAIAVGSVELHDRGQWTVWELTVDQNENFTVLAGDDPVLVHNCNRLETDADGNRVVFDDDGNILATIDPQDLPVELRHFLDDPDFVVKLLDHPQAAEIFQRIADNPGQLEFYTTAFERGVLERTREVAPDGSIIERDGIEDLTNALRKNGTDLTGGELEALYKASVGTLPDQNPFGESFDRLVDRGYEWDPETSQWSKGGRTYDANLVADARKSIDGNIPDKTAIDSSDLPDDFDGSSNAIGDAGEAKTRQRAEATNPTFIESEVPLSVTITTPDGPLTVDIRADQFTITPDGELVIWESKATSDPSKNITPSDFTDGQLLVLEAIENGTISDVTSTFDEAADAINRASQATGGVVFGEPQIDTWYVPTDG